MNNKFNCLCQFLDRENIPIPVIGNVVDDLASVVIAAVVVGCSSASKNVKNI